MHYCYNTVSVVSDLLRHLRLFRVNAERILTKLDRKNILKPFTKFVFFGPIRKTSWPPGLQLAETLSISPLNHWAEFENKNLIVSKISTSSTKSRFVMLIKKAWWPPWPLICRDIFNVILDYRSPTNYALPLTDLYWLIKIQVSQYLRLLQKVNTSLIVYCLVK